jgi:YHS domain-containing protein
MNQQAKDPICGKDVDPLRARAVGIFGGVTYYFCSAECKAKFKDPRKVPREPTRDFATRGKAESPRALAAGGEPTPKKEPSRPKVEAPPAKAEPPRAFQPMSEPSTSVKLDLDALRNRSGRTWIVALLLLAVAGAVLFFAFLRH